MLWFLTNLGLIGAAINFFDQFYYPNYFFSHFGLVPSQLSFVLTMLTLSGVFIGLKLNKTKINAQHLLFFASLFIMLPGVFAVTGKATARVFKIFVSGRNFTRSELINTYGRKFEFIEFLRSNTSQTSSFLLPPNRLPWRHTGDYNLMRAWLYPRRVYAAPQTGQLSSDLYLQFDNILISSESDGQSIHTWPDFIIPAVKIIIYDWDRQSGIIYDHVDYRPGDWQAKEPWGLIVPKPI